jgi:hypothetical protein
MMIYENKNGLKGLHNLAQGKRSGALGWKTNKKIVRAISLIKAKFIVRTNETTLFFSGNDILQFRPKEIICIAHRILADGFSSASYTQGDVSDRSSRNFTLGYDILAFQAGKNSTINLCIKSSTEDGGGKILSHFNRILTNTGRCCLKTQEHTASYCV